jgi:hypothetical protein
MPRTEETPGLVWRTRGNGSSAAYWVARTDLVKLGYRPKTVRLHYPAGDPQIAARCHVLQAEMLKWATDNRTGQHVLYDGTFASLARFYETHPDSPYHDLEPDTARTYSKTLAWLMKLKGGRRVDAVDGADVRRWYKEICESSSKGWAYFVIAVLKAALSFGSTKRIDECRLLRAELRDARFSPGRRRKEFLTYAQVAAFRRAADDLGLGWMALCLTLQFEFGMRRRDVIGKWVIDEMGSAAIRHGRRVWRDGLTWGNIGSDGVLRKVISKTRNTSEAEAGHAIADYPDVEALLARVPADRRVGPLVIYPRTGLPPSEAQCRRHFRIIASAAGIPENVWNMDARAGANTEAFNAGTTADERMALLTHSEKETNDGYVRDLLPLSRRAAAKRVGSRGKE